ncbi:MAG: S8 family serine peptidase [Rhizobiaceae bacterium]
MDPALQELITKGDPGDQVEAIMRLKDCTQSPPRHINEICGFGDIRTIRLARRDILHVWSDPAVASLKAAKTIAVERPLGLSRFLASRNGPTQGSTAARRPSGLHETGRGIVVGVVDWGFDFAHPAFADENNKSRILALWDQRDSKLPTHHTSPQPYGYGRVFTWSQINQALKQQSPYEWLQYHPGDADHGRGAHGTHVADIAAGSPRGNGAGGLAPDAQLVFVHLATDRLGGLSDLGNSVRIVEAIHFIDSVAGDVPCVINLSLGRHGGSKSGQSLVERALDAFAQSRDNACIVQSAGNYFLSDCHASGTLRPGGARNLEWKVKRGDVSENELEIWYSNRDRFRVSLTSPDRQYSVAASLFETKIMRQHDGFEIARLYNRAFEPNTNCHNCNVFIRKGAPAGTWTVRIEGEQVVDGRFDSWIERDSGGRRKQSKFSSRDVDTTSTIGSIASGFHSIVVGAAQLTNSRLISARFGSSGPTRDGRTKPDVAAPGVRVLAARSTFPEASEPLSMNTRMSGASQAAPYVTGLAALCLEAGRGNLDFQDVRKAIIGTCERARNLKLEDILRLGAGMVNPYNAVEAARIIGLSKAATNQEDTL